MKTKHPAAIALLLLLLAAAPSDAAVWTVEKDGSGDFSVIQDAVDASADGDTLMIGPGRFDDYRRYDHGVWEGRIIHVMMNDRSLTIIGSGQGSTVIGPETEFPITEHDDGFVLLYDAELYLSGVTIERCYGGIVCWDNSYVEVDRCSFEHHTWGVGCAIFTPRGAKITNSTFLNYDTGVFPGNWSVGVIVENCVFREVVAGLNTTATQDLLVKDCLIEDSFTGVKLWSSSTATLVNLDIETTSTSLIVRSDSSAELTNSRLLGSLDDNLTTVWIDGHSSLTGSGNILRGDDDPPLRIYRSDVTLADSHILVSSGYAVYCEPPTYAGDDKVIDLRNNWWGVSDADSIASLIYDGHDSPDLDILVDYLPFRDGQVSSEAMGWGELKRLYR